MKKQKQKQYRKQRQCSGRNSLSPKTGLQLILLLLLLSCSPSKPLDEKIQVSEVLGTSENQNFKKALKPYSFRFPQDHGAHEEFQSEWWYYTGNLEASNGDHFGYQVTFFRSALDSESSPKRASRWATHQFFMGHFALTDVRHQKFYAFERFSRGGSLGLTLIQDFPYLVKLENWKVQGSPHAEKASLEVSEGDIRLHLDLTNQKPIVLQGEKGLSKKGSQPGNASYYYSMTRLETNGTIQIKNSTHKVVGLSWMDREWSTSSLEKGVQGWDWFSLQLEDKRDLMYYQLRTKDGKPTPYSSGTLVDPKGKTRSLSFHDVDLKPIQFWESPDTHVRYPVVWELKILKENLILTIKPFIENQELRLSFRYWEGAVQIFSPQGKILGQGYMELTGY